MNSGQRAPARGTDDPVTVGTKLGLFFFALIVISGPLLFGFVDRLPQIGLLILLGLGILARPLVIEPMGRWGNRFAIGFVALLVACQFAPARWFGDVQWRTILTRQFALELPFTHHPEPALALDALLAAAIGVIWFWWVRRLAAERSCRAILAWILFAAAAVVAIVAFLTRKPGSEAIYGLRFTPGWSGFGPFPNRNHSADFFAMAAVLGAGCVVWAGVRKRWLMCGGGVILLGLILIALLATESRGGLLAFAAGIGIFILLCLAKSQNRRAIGGVLGAVVFFGVLMYFFGGPVLARFHSREAGEVSTNMRVAIWHDAAALCRDAPLLGHGLESFAEIFPLYETVKLENQIVLHPESSWILWLSEIGAVPLLLALPAATLFLSRHARDIFRRRGSFALHAAGLSAFGVLVIHSIFDVPAHRWATAGFALAALAVACPVRLPGRRGGRATWWMAVVPLAVAAFWALPLLYSLPAWSPLVVTRLLERDDKTPRQVSLDEVLSALRYFPLNPDLHESAGMRELRSYGSKLPASWQREFAIASRLLPGAWDIAMAQARACQPVVPALALKYWAEAVEEGGIHREEILGTALQETARLPDAPVYWGNYVEEHPDLLLAYARALRGPEGRWLQPH